MNGIDRIDRVVFREPPWWKFGRKFDFWLKNIKLISDVIKKNKLTPVPAESLMMDEIIAPMAIPGGRSRKAPSKLRIPPFPGGIRIPHFHFRGDIYLLNEKQWNAFSAGVVKDFKAKLDKINTVSFDRVMEMSEVIDSLV